MTERVLTDDDLHKIACENYIGSIGPTKMLCAVEAATLARVPDYLRKMGEYREGGYAAHVRDILRAAADALEGYTAMRTFTYVTEREARKRERKAWDEACIVLGVAPDHKALLRDARYPVPACDKCGQKLP